MGSGLRLLKFVLIGMLVGNCAAGLLGYALSASPMLRNVMLALGTLAGATLAYLRWRAENAGLSSSLHGSAQFGRHSSARQSLGGDGLIVGRADRGWLLRYAGPAHLLTIAPTRSGKGVGAIIPNLLTADRSVICIDPKGENAAITARARRTFGRVHILDPFEVTGEESAAFNPLAALDPDSIDAGEEAALIADALVYDPPQQVSEAHWNEEAKALLAGFILHAAASPYAARRNLAHVRDLITSAPQRLELELRSMQASGAARGLVARAANRHLAKADREAAGVLSAAQRHTHFLDSPRMTKLMSRCDFSFGDLRQDHTTVFLVLPPDRLATHARWLRLMIVQAVSALARAGPATGQPPVLFLLDEFAALGRLEPVERAFGLMAGYGVQLWPILQDLHQLRAAYGQASGTFLSNAGITQVFNVADIDTATWVSRTLGVGTEAYYSTSTSASSTGGQHPSSSHGSSTSLNFVKRDLMTPDEVMRVDHDFLLLIRPGDAPLFAGKVRYFADREFQGLFDARSPAGPGTATIRPRRSPTNEPQIEDAGG